MSERDPDTGRFLAGNSGNGGRPKGARSKLGEAFLDDLYTDWQQHGKEVVEAVRIDKPDVYLKVVASILPKDLNLNVNKFEEYSDDELIERLRELHEHIGPLLDAEGGDGDIKRDKAKTTH